MKSIILALILLPPLISLSWGCSSVKPPVKKDLALDVDRCLTGGRYLQAIDKALLYRKFWPEDPQGVLLWVFASKAFALNSKTPGHDLLDSLEAACIELGDRDPEMVESWYALGVIRRDRGDLDGAIRAWDVALKRRTFHRKTLEAYAGLMYSIGKERAAAALYERVLRLPPPRAEVYYRLGVCALADAELPRDVKPENYNKAASFYRQALGLDSKHVGALHGLAWIILRSSRLSGRWKEKDLREEDGVKAASYLEMALKVEPGHVESLHDLAWIYNELGQAEEAEKYFRRALETDPGHVPSLVDLADFLDDRGKNPEEVLVMRKLALAKTKDPMLSRALKRSLAKGRAR